jgi:hypothetical protein
MSKSQSHHRAAAIVAIALLFTASAPAVAQSARLHPAAMASSDLSGTWRGQVSHNVVSIMARPGGIDVRAVTNNPGQTQAAFFKMKSDGSYRLDFGNGTEAIVQVIGADQMRVTNPDGWTDVFDRAR